MMISINVLLTVTPQVTTVINKQILLVLTILFHVNCQTEGSNGFNIYNIIILFTPQELSFPFHIVRFEIF